MSENLLVASDENQKQNPNLSLAQKVYSYELATSKRDAARAETLKNEILQAIQDDTMTPYYLVLCSRFSWSVDDEMVSRLRYIMISF